MFVEEKVITVTRGNVTLAIEALPLPSDVTNLIDKNDKLLQDLDSHLTSNIGGRSSKYDRQTSLSDSSIEKLNSLKTNIQKAFSDTEGVGFPEDVTDRIWCFGPRKYGPNILVNSVEGYNRPSIWQLLYTDTDTENSLREFDSSMVNGFQLSTLTGPMCSEPMRGVAFVVRKWEVVNSPAPNPAGKLFNHNVSSLLLQPFLIISGKSN